MFISAQPYFAGRVEPNRPSSAIMPDELRRERAGAVVLLDDRQDAVVDELPHGVADEDLFFAQETIKC